MTDGEVFDEARFPTMKLDCAQCGWSGTGAEASIGELFAEILEYNCPSCLEPVGFWSLPFYTDPDKTTNRIPWDADSTTDPAAGIEATMTISGLDAAVPQLLDELTKLLHTVASENPDYAGALSGLVAELESTAADLRDGKADERASTSGDDDPRDGDAVVVAKSTMNICDSPEIMATYRRGVADIIRRLAFEQVDLSLARVLHTVVQRFLEAGPTTAEEIDGS